MKQTHIIWDWNGTLLDDVHISLFAANQALIEIGQEPINLMEYRYHYSVPVQKFYRSILGREPSEQEWRNIGKTFNYYYKPNIKTASLCSDAIDALQYCCQQEMTQSVCSLMEQDELNVSVFNTQVSQYFNLVDGRDTPLLKTGKQEQLSRHIEKLNISPSLCVVIGDAVDDALSAFQVGAKAILYTGGTHSFENLSKTGAYVVSSLKEASMLADDII